MTSTIPMAERLRAEYTRIPDTGSRLINPDGPEAAALIGTLVEALEPFGAAAKIKLCGNWRDDEHFGQTDVAFELTFGDLRRAFSALTAAKGE